MKNIITKIRYWLIRFCAGSDIGVAINLNIEDKLHIVDSDDKKYLICGNTIGKNCF